MTIAALHITCGSPSGDVVATIDPGGDMVTLLDDGAGVDQVAGDGVYSGQWTPEASGAYSLEFAGTVVPVIALSPYAFSPTAYAYRTVGTSLQLDDDTSA